ncbi:hypothetical protein YC2023_116477 [Brassica napus]
MLSSQSASNQVNIFYLDTSWFRFESIILPRAARRASSHAQLVDLVETDVYAQGLLDKLSNSQEDETDQGECNKQRFGCGEEIIKASAMMFVKVNASILFRQHIDAGS